MADLRRGVGVGLGDRLFAVRPRSLPLSDNLSATAGWALWTAVSGLLFGYIRAKSGSFVASGLVHGVLLAVAAVLAELTAN